MATKNVMEPLKTESTSILQLIGQYNSGPIDLAATDNGLYTIEMAQGVGRQRPGIFVSRGDTLLTYADQDVWAEKAILNVAGSGKFSSDRTIAEYAADIWEVKPCPVS